MSGQNGVLRRDAILSVADLPRERVEVPEWGGAVFVRTLTGKERDAFEKSLVTGKGKQMQLTLSNVRGRLAVQAIVDEEGQRIFSDADADALGDKSALALERIFEVAMRLAGLKEEDVDELMGESEGGRSVISPSGSPATSAAGTST